MYLYDRHTHPYLNSSPNQRLDIFEHASFDAKEFMDFMGSVWQERCRKVISCFTLVIRQCVDEV